MSIVKADLCYKSKGEQAQLLQQVLAASDADADDERIPGEMGAKGGPVIFDSFEALMLKLISLCYTLNFGPVQLAQCRVRMTLFTWNTNDRLLTQRNIVSLRNSG